jgi:hypothetical protein
VSFFFQKKKQKALVLLRRRLSHTYNSAKPTQGVWGRAPSKSDTLLFPEKEAKSVCSASQKSNTYPNLGEADPGGSGGVPPAKAIPFFFQKKKQKAFVLLRRSLIHTQTSAKPGCAPN